MAVADCIRQCRRCGVEFRRTAKGQPTRYCSHRCRENRKTTRARRGERVIKPCANCHGGMSLSPARAAKQTYCSSSCYLASIAPDNRCGLCGCSVPGKVDHRNAGTYCSQAHYHAARSLLAAEASALQRIAANWARQSRLVIAECMALRRIARYVEKPRLKRRACLDCGAQVVCVKDSGKRCNTCSTRRAKALPSFRASRRVQKARRRAAERGLQADRIDPIKVFYRDGWRCHLCGCKTPKELRGTYQPRAPELDHVIPLAMGGTHTWGNVKCSCRACNGAKGATAAGQLGLNIAA